MSKADWREVFKEELAACQSPEERDQLIGQLEPLKEEAIKRAWRDGLINKTTTLGVMARRNKSEMQGLLDNPSLNREAAEPLVDWLRNNYGVWWMSDIHQKLIDRFVKDASDPWWQHLWRVAEDQYTQLGSMEEDREDRQDEAARIVGQLLGVPGIQINEVNWLSETEQPWLMAQVMDHPDISEEEALAFIAQVSTYGKEVCWDGYFYRVSERGAGHTGLILKALKEGGAEVGELVGKVLGKVSAQQLEDILPEAANQHGKAVAEWLRETGGDLVDGWPKKLLNQLLRSTSKEVRVAMTGVLAQIGKREGQKSDEAKQTKR